ncbi:MAG: hypothetical protein ACI9FN_003073 [Saprospiraceae bacterium]|jgi:hypothetical protein
MKENKQLLPDIIPFTYKLGFKKLFDHYDEMHANGSPLDQELAGRLLKSVKSRDILCGGLESSQNSMEYEDDIQKLLAPLFPAPLVKNEIKIATPPLSNEILRATDRFRSIFGETNEIPAKEFESFDNDKLYVFMCSFILQSYYGIPLKGANSPVYDIVNSKGITQHYKTTYNADFLTFSPLYEEPVLTDELIFKLKNGFDNIDLWKSVFPPNSWEINGFSLRSFVDVSQEEALTRIKNCLIGDKVKKENSAFKVKMDSYQRTLLNLPDIEVEFNIYDSQKGEFRVSPNGNRSFALNNLSNCAKKDLLCDYAANLIFNLKTTLVQPDLDKISDAGKNVPIWKSLISQGIKSYMLTPLYYEDQLLGFLEFASKINGAFDHSHPLKIQPMIGLCTNAVKQFSDEWENQKTAVIQNEFTAIHNSVAWKFREEAEKYLLAREQDDAFNFDNILFHDLTALYGQIDISGSSQARNEAIAKDLKQQIGLVQDIINKIHEIVNMPLLESIQFQIEIISEKLSSDLAAGMEQEVLEFLRRTINPLIEEMRLRDSRLEDIISNYMERLGPDMEIIYNERKKYDDSVKKINGHLAMYLDEAQVEAQKIYPHYFERYKTDGVEHNIFIGQEIAPTLNYNKLYLDNLRLWQLKIICELELEHSKRKPQLPLPLEVASLIMVYSNPIAIRYRMDEKQFDVDGAYNARYEIIKKRIDKAHIKGTTERITQPGKIVIIYTQPHDLEEYMNYINFLTYQGYLKGEAEVFDIEDLQGVVGLRGVRVDVNFEKEMTQEKRINDVKLQLQEVAS